MFILVEGDGAFFGLPVEEIGNKVPFFDDPGESRDRMTVDTSQEQFKSSSTDSSATTIIHHRGSTRGYLAKTTQDQPPWRLCTIHICMNYRNRPRCPPAVPLPPLLPPIPRQCHQQYPSTTCPFPHHADASEML